MSLSNQAVDLIQRGKGGSYSLSRDANKHNLWDHRYFTAATVNNWTYFVVPIGGQWENGQKTLTETNMSDSGKLPNGQTFLVQRMGLALISPIAADQAATQDLVQAYYTWLQHAVYEIRIAGREYDFQVHGRQFISSVAASAELATNFPVRVGDSIASGWVSLSPTEIFIDQLVSFQVLERVAAADITNVVSVMEDAATLLQGAYCYVQCTLEGFLTRAK